MLERLARWSYTHRWRILAIWIVALVGAIFAAKVGGGDYASNFSLPGAESQHALDLLKARFPSESGGTVDIGSSDHVTIENCVFNGGATSVHFYQAHDALITNNVFNNVTGGVVTGWGLDQSTISHNEFYNCWQPISLDFVNDPTHGRDITISQNYFTGTGRMDIEVGPGDTAYTSNMQVTGNW